MRLWDSHSQLVSNVGSPAMVMATNRPTGFSNANPALLSCSVKVYTTGASIVRREREGQSMGRARWECLVEVLYRHLTFSLFEQSLISTLSSLFLFHRLPVFGGPG